jgi:hypothetical protein
LGCTYGKKQCGGCVAGTANYTPEDLNALLDILEEHLPLGGNAWNSTDNKFNIWAQESGQPSQTSKSLELKFKQVRIQSFFLQNPVHFSVTACENC